MKGRRPSKDVQKHAGRSENNVQNRDRQRWRGEIIAAWTGRRAGKGKKGVVTADVVQKREMKAEAGKKDGECLREPLFRLFLPA